MNWRVEEVLSGIKAAFCKHDYIYEQLADGRRFFIFRCSKCGKGIKIKISEIENRLEELKLEPCKKYPVGELYLPSFYCGDTYYVGRHIEKAIVEYYRKYGVLISQYGIQKYGVSKEVREQS